MLVVDDESFDSCLFKHRNDDEGGEIPLFFFYCVFILAFAAYIWAGGNDKHFIY